MSIQISGKTGKTIIMCRKLDVNLDIWKNQKNNNNVQKTGCQFFLYFSKCPSLFSQMSLGNHMWTNYMGYLRNYMSIPPVSLFWKLTNAWERMKNSGRLGVLALKLTSALILIYNRKCTTEKLTKRPSFTLFL